MRKVAKEVTAVIAAFIWAYVPLSAKPAHAQQRDCNQYASHPLTNSPFTILQNAFGDPTTTCGQPAPSCQQGSTDTVDCQCMNWQMSGTFGIASDPGNPFPCAGGTGYPNILQGLFYDHTTSNSGLPIQVSSIRTWPITWTISGTASPGRWNASIEFWAWTSNPLTQPPPHSQLGTSSCTNAACGQADGTELMIWLSTDGADNLPDGILPEAQTFIAGIDWDVRATRIGPGSTHWNYVAYYPHPPDPQNLTSGNITTIAADFAPFFRDAETRTGIPHNNGAGPCQDATSGVNQCLDSSWWVTSVQAGFELFAPAGAGVGLSSSGFDSALNAPLCNLSASCTVGGSATVSGVASTGIGVEGASNSGAGVSGTSTSGSGVSGTGGQWPAAGVYGTSAATSNGVGVVGMASGFDSEGVFGQGDLAGVQGYSTATGGWGVQGTAAGSGGHGVDGTCNGACAGSAGSYAVYANGPAGGTTIWNPSDVRMKKDIKDAPYGIEQALKLRPVTYLWKNEDLGKDSQVGLIAQEVQRVFPELVRQDADGTLALNYVQLVPVLVRAIQQQQAELSRLERKRTITSTVLRGSAGALTIGLIPLGYVAARRKRMDRS